MSQQGGGHEPDNSSAPRSDSHHHALHHSHRVVCLMPGATQGPGSRWSRRPHYGGDYKVRARAVRRRAYLDPTTVCRRCGLTLEERRVTHPADEWDAGHEVAGEVGGQLAPKHASCNRAAGARSQQTRYSSYSWWMSADRAE
jgi:hypothetical protein